MRSSAPPTVVATQTDPRPRRLRPARRRPGSGRRRPPTTDRRARSSHRSSRRSTANQHRTRQRTVDRRDPSNRPASPSDRRWRAARRRHSAGLTNARFRPTQQGAPWPRQRSRGPPPCATAADDDPPPRDAWLRRAPGRAEDPPFELLQLRPRLEAELVGEPVAGRLHDGEGVGLSPGAVEREHQLAEEPLAQRMLAHEPLQLGHELGAACRARARPRTALRRPPAAAPRAAPHRRCANGS